MGFFDRNASRKKVLKKGRTPSKRSRPSNQPAKSPRKGLSRLIPSPPGSGKGPAGSVSTGRQATTRSYSEADILNSGSATVSDPGTEPSSPNGYSAADGGVAGDEASRGRFEGRFYKKDGRIGTKADEQNLADTEIFDAEGTLWSRVIFWMVTVLAVLGALVLAFVLLRVAIELWPGGSESASGSTAATEVSSSGDERAAASVAEGFVESYLTMSAAEDSTDIDARLAPFVSSSQLSSQVAAQSSADVDRQVMSSSTYRVSAVGDGRYAVSVDALTLTDSNSGDDSSEDRGSPLDRQALKVYVGGSEANFSIVAPPVAITPPSAGDDLSGALSGVESTELTDEALEDHLRGYFSAAYGAADAQASVEQFFTDGAQMPVAPAEDYTYLDLDGANLYEIPAEEVDERYSAAYRVEAYISVREESTGSTSYQTHLLEVAKEGGEWTIIDTIGG